MAGGGTPELDNGRNEANGRRRLRSQLVIVASSTPNACNLFLQEVEVQAACADAVT